MFDVDNFIADCRTALGETEPLLAVRDVLERVMRAQEDVAAALPATRAVIEPIHRTDDLSIFKVVWAPGMRFPPHDHLVWAAIGLYAGQEDNEFFRPAEHGLDRAGGKELRAGDVALLGDDAIHAITNPLQSYTGAIHVYGGDLPATSGRREWDEDTNESRPVDFERTRRRFEEANARFDAIGGSSTGM